MKKVYKDNYRVVIDPNLRYSPYSFRQQERLEKWTENICRNIVEEVKRHVDDVGYVAIEYDTQEVCEFCDREWEVWELDDEPDGHFKGEPLCCMEAKNEWFLTNGHPTWD